MNASNGNTEDDHASYNTSFKNEMELLSDDHPYGRDLRKRLKRTTRTKAAIRKPAGRRNEKPPGSKCIHETRKKNFLWLLCPEIRDMILSYLDYQSLIRLSQVNKHHYNMGLREKAAVSDKNLFVMRAEKEFRRYRLRGPTPYGLGRFACYYCFRVLPSSVFATHLRQEAYVDNKLEFVPDDKANKYVHRLVKLHRTCLLCGFEFGLYKGLLKNRSGKLVWLDESTFRQVGRALLYE